jgi:hypothetical protein
MLRGDRSNGTFVKHLDLPFVVLDNGLVWTLNSLVVSLSNLRATGYAMQAQQKDRERNENFLTINHHLLGKRHPVVVQYGRLS